jgi:hypothetical protein
MREYDRLDFISHTLWAVAWAFAVGYVLMLLTPQ